MEHVNIPVPAPAVIWFPAIVGPGDVPQQTPRSVMVNPAGVVTFPPVVEVLAAIEVTVVVFTDGKSGTGSGAFCSQLNEIKANSSKKYMCFIYQGLTTNIGEILI